MGHETRGTGRTFLSLVDSEGQTSQIVGKLQSQAIPNGKCVVWSRTLPNMDPKELVALLLSRYLMVFISILVSALPSCS